MIRNYIMMMSKDEAVRHFLYPLGNERRVMEDGMLALHSGYKVLILPPEREAKRELEPGR